MPVRLIAIDLDGTLLGPEGVGDGDRDAILEARRRGIEIVIATGRSWLESLEALDRIGREGVMIGAGGALMHAADSGETLARSVVHEDVVRAVATGLRAHGHVVHLLQDPSRAGFDYWMVGWDRLHEASRWWFERDPGRNEARGRRRRERPDLLHVRLHRDPDPGHGPRAHHRPAVGRPPLFVKS